ncbi:MAG TPA: hypothetical protein VLL47_11590, partial [Robiginitalea sp.]|nr:hypothetical protein [Robiginitalea sp.]
PPRRRRGRVGIFTWGRILEHRSAAELLQEGGTPYRVGIFTWERILEHRSAAEVPQPQPPNPKSHKDPFGDSSVAVTPEERSSMEFLD